MTLTREAILAHVERRREVQKVTSPDLGDVLVRKLTCKEIDAFEAGLERVGKDGTRTPNTRNFRGRLAALVLSDERGERLFTDDDAEALGDLPATALAPVILAAKRLSGLSEGAVEDAKGN